MIHINERHMLESFLQHKSRFFSCVTGEKTNRKFVITEFNSSFGVADAVIGTYSTQFSKKMMRPSVDPNWVDVVGGCCEGAGLDAKSIAEAHGTSIATVRKKMQQFLDAKLLSKSCDGRYVAADDYRVIIKSSLAIEAKLRDWNKALRQARRYRKFANFSFVLLDEDHCGPALSGIAEFQAHGIGLASMGKRKVTIHYSPERHTPNAGVYVYKLNECAYDYFKKCLVGFSAADASQ
ncbi:MAG: hypothetical protein PHI97_33175 [Desulfobulbus sp.]|nr:hypothetical protein [Desulfobulbus sp.]